MLKHLLHTAVAASLALLMQSAYADAPNNGQGMTVEQFMSSLKFQDGKIDLPNGIATLNLPANFRYLNPADTNKVLVELWGNPPGGTTLGMIVPTSSSLASREGWGVIVTYEENGHIKDDDASSTDFNKLLKEMQESQEEENKERVKQGYKPLKLGNWAEPPHYDATTRKLYWALDLSSGEHHSLNYNVRVLGRKGVLVLNAVSGMEQLATVKTEMQQVIGFSDFKPGNTYADFNSSTDKVAEYGIAALIAGGVAAKMGLFAKLLALLIAFKKFVIIGVVALGAGIMKLLGMRKKDE